MILQYTEYGICRVISLLLFSAFTRAVQGQEICSHDNSGQCLPTGTDPVVICCSGPNIFTIPQVNDNVAILDIYNTSIDVVDRIHYPKLHALHLENNNIRYIKDNAFQGLGNLKFLYLQRNEITGLTSKTFIGLKNLSIINLSMNPLYELKKNVFSDKNMPSITEIKMNECRLYSIEIHAFSFLSNLCYLNLTYNRLTQLPYFDKRDELKSLHTIDLSGNSITSIDGRGLDTIPNLQTLILHRNLITVIAEHALHGLSDSLVYLDLSYNLIYSVEPVAFTALQKLTELDLSHNSITQLTWEELPWDSLNKFEFTDNHWNCSCVNSWMIEDIYPMLRTFNALETTVCYSPASLKGQQVYSIDKSHFKCPNLRSEHKQNKITAGIVVSVLIVIMMVVGIGCYMYRKNTGYICCWRRRNMPYDKVTANGGIHM